jgi:ankyrin repeat protein
MKKHKIRLALIFTVSAVLLISAIALFRSPSNNVKLLNAAESGDLETVKSLIKQGTSINNLSTQFGSTPLIGAIYFDQTNIVEYLAEVGADVNLADNNSKTPLMWATGRGDEGIPMVNCLISHGANLDTKDKNSLTVFDYAKATPQAQKLIEVLETAKRDNDKSR